jgi:lipopolysaccharide export system protein LptA
VATYTGDVIITQGSMVIKGNTVTMTRTPTATSTWSPRWATWPTSSSSKALGAGQVERLGRDHPVPGAKEMVILTDRAKVENEGNTTEGEKIVYDTKTQVATAGAAATSLHHVQRIDMVIQPKKKAE